MDILHDVTGREQEEEAITPERAFQYLQEWGANYGKALTGINPVDAIREDRESR